jgi:hypothetical protein
MVKLIQARLPDELASAARRRAADQHRSLSSYLTDLVRRDAEAARREAFWAEVERTMTTPQARADLADDAAGLADTLGDGLSS